MNSEQDKVAARVTMPAGRSTFLRRTVVVPALVACGCGGETETPVPPGYVEPPSFTQLDSSGRQTALRFTDVTAEAGIDFTHVTGAFGEKWMPETMGSGGGFLDYDADGWPDIFLVNGAEWSGHQTGAAATARLYRNLRDGRFADVTRVAGLDISLYGMGAAFADYDGDGDTDVYLTAVGDNVLMRNDGGVFRDVTDAMRVTGNGERAGSPRAWSTGAAWVDVDRDGWVDLFVCNYVQWTPETDLFTTLDGVNKSYATPQQYQGESCRLYRNERGRAFVDVTEPAGVLNHEGKSLGVAVGDFNGDLWPDLVVANDVQPNFLYLNNGDGTFVDVAPRAGVGFDEFGRARAGMGVDVADVMGDGNLSIAIGNFSREPVSLYTQIGEELFQDRAGAARLTRSTLLPLTFGVLFADLDLDGAQDLLLANGHIEPDINTVQQDITFAQPPQVFVNDGQGRFHDVGPTVSEIFTQPLVARGIATADYDRDNDLDVLLTTNGAEPVLLRNDLPVEANWIGVHAKGNAPNRQAIGAVVTVFAGDLTQRRMVRTGSSYLSQSMVQPLVFGMGKHTQVDSLTVEWPVSGRRDVIGPLEVRMRYVVAEDAAGQVTQETP